VNCAREVTSQETTATGTETTLVLKRTLPATPDRVFAAWTRPELVRRWFSPGEMAVEEAALDVRVGGRRWPWPCPTTSATLGWWI